ncbi:hypothetical protein I8748_01140 [Nostoc sp. CENA67]|uniref:Uncharacterized protein n=1 Tax=Amazonocrinis nigriterrae CENA67 TaxID=2794033 RepID=A0A8J7HJV7_9NOST|nr:hypothetical protein [Amazonocrinis nigriterrae]MBH8560816.1 hypothetical protein [Amazonocrinis nigriterrae CENA67]
MTLASSLLLRRSGVTLLRRKSRSQERSPETLTGDARTDARSSLPLR